MTTTSAHDRLLQAVLLLGLLAAVPGVWLGLFLVQQDLGTSGEWLDRLGVAAGLVVLALVLVPAGLATVALLRCRRGRPDAAGWALAAAGTGLVAAGLLAWNHLDLLPFAAVPLLVGVVAAVARRARRSW